MKKTILKDHPCFNALAHFRWARVHLPVAPRCNIRCNFCERKVNSSEKRPGCAEKILLPDEAIKWLEQALKRDVPIKVVAVAGPGEPLFNDETFEVMMEVKKRFPHLIRCIATNGTLLLDKMELLIRAGIDTVTVSMCAVDANVGKKIYEYVSFNGRRYSGEKGAALLIKRQIQGIKALVKNKIPVKVNTVFIPGINSDHIIDVASLCKDLGVYIMNIMPLIPAGRFKKLKAPSKEELDHIRNVCSFYIRQFRLCKQCRADACGIPGGEDGTLGSACI
ncbi:MAG: nitrogenase molybdenum-iron cofactor biosynthesis protein [Deltaproteobacteria bacterium]|nr:MAG: nitrogenase molybdenum-iron cofactor biosynthesis protein [Deltaproteobacteria bacterium]